MNLFFRLFQSFQKSSKRFVVGIDFFRNFRQSLNFL